MEFKEEVFNQLLEGLPPVFPRSAVSKLFPGILNPRTLSNLGRKGPPYKLIAGKCVYEKESFLCWLKNK